MTKSRRSLILSAALCLTGLARAQAPLTPVERILDEGKNHSQVWQTLLTLSEQIGPRLTGSTRLTHACMWAREQFSRMGLSNCHLEKWGDVPVGFDRGPCSARVLVPEARDLEFTAAAWSAGTEGPVQGPVLAMPKSRADLEALGERLNGAWVLSESSRRRRPSADESDEDKAAREEAEAVAAEVRQLPIAGLVTGSRNDLVVTGGTREWRELTMETLPKDVSITLTRTDFEAIQAWLAEGQDVQLEVDLDHSFVEGPVPLYNVVAEIPGTEQPDEVVILSAHLDSWDGPGSMGTQDNGTGSSVMLEAARILMTTGVKPKRTIRFCLWTGEEQGLLGSRAYVDSLTEDEKAKITAALVDDGGTNYQGGLVCIESMRPMLDEAIAPLAAAFPDYSIENSVQDRMPRGGASDHASFNRVGIPGFFWIEKGTGGREERNYTFVHHTQHDTPRYAVEEYLVQSATASAAVAAYLADAPTLLPRELPEEEVVETEEPFDAVASPVSGLWEVGFTGEDAPDWTFTLDLKVDAAGQLRGKMKTGMGDLRIKEGSWDAATQTASFVIASDFGTSKYQGTLADGVLTGTSQRGDRDPRGFRATRPPAAETPISGTWRATLTERGSEFRMHFEVIADGTVTGWVKSSQTDSPLFDGRWDAETKTVTFEYDYPHAGRLPVKATLEGEKLTGTVGESAAFEAVHDADSGSSADGR